jgi:hypothetical protein
VQQAAIKISLVSTVGGLGRKPGDGRLLPAQPDRKGERLRDDLAALHGVVQADAYGGDEALTGQVGPLGLNAPSIMQAAYWAHAQTPIR